MRSLIPLAACAALLAFAGTAAADGPFEPNETAATATGPVLQSSLAAGLETPQDVDWYVLYVRAPKQIGVLATLLTACPKPTGRLLIDLLDADEEVSYERNLGTIGLGWDPAAPSASAPVTAGRVAFTSVRGHRYFLRVKQIGCEGAGYSLELAHSNALTSRLDITAECLAATKAETVAKRKAARLKRAVKRARKSRRSLLRLQYDMARQAVKVAASDRQSRCTRRGLTGYPFE